MDRPEAQTLTFLFTDIEGSTRLWDEDPDAMRGSLTRHDTVVRDSLEAEGGTVFKNTGDGMCATFATTTDAARAAAAVQRRIDEEKWPDATPVAVRIGIHLGTADVRDGDYFGPALNRTSRIMSAAHGGQVVLSERAAKELRPEPPEGLGVIDLGTHRLRGLSDPERIHQLEVPGRPSTFAPLASVEAFPTKRPTPDETFRTRGSPLMGRTAEISKLEDAWRDSQRGTRGVVLVAGEPGIGKTRLVAELADRIDSDGGSVLYGSCDENAVVPYQPFVEALRSYVASISVTVLHERLRGLEHDLARVFPELEGRLGGPSARATLGDARADRYRLFEGVLGIVTGLCATGPAALVLDDLHWADEASLLLLRHLLRSMSDTPLLVIGCYRDTEVSRRDQAADLLSDVLRIDNATRISLDGLSDDESASLLNEVAGREVAPELVHALHDQTDGNPFFLVEFLKSLDESDRDLITRSTGIRVDFTVELPERARDVVGRRVRRLPDDVGDIVATAAVTGSTFTSALVSRIHHVPERSVLANLDVAIDAGLITEQPGHPGTYSFAHAFIRQTVYADLPSSRLSALHADVAVAIEGMGDKQYPAATLAHHYTRALPLGDRSRAMTYTITAGRDAVDDLAFERAASLFQRALDLAADGNASDEEPNVELLIEYAGALVFVDETLAVDAALRAVERARDHGSPQQLAQAVAVLTEPVSAVVADPDRTVELFDEAQRGLADGDHALRARLLAIEAFKYAAYQLHGRDPRELGRAAVGAARESHDPVTLAESLFALATSLEAEPDASERITIGDELVSLGKGEAGRASTATAYGLRVLAGAHLDTGNTEQLVKTVAELTRVGQDLRWLPALVYEAQWRATLATVEARFDDVTACWDDMRRYSRAYRGVGGMIGQQALFLARERGQLAEYRGSLHDTSANNPSNVYIRSLLALAQLDDDDPGAAGSTLDDLAGDGFRQGERGGGWPVVLGALAEVAVTTHSAEHAETLRELLEPFSGTLLTAVVGLGCIGSADRYLGMLSAAGGDYDLSERYFSKAIEIESRVKGRALLARTRYWQARSVTASASSDGEKEAERLVSDVAQESGRLGMQRLERQATTLAHSIRSGG